MGMISMLGEFFMLSLGMGVGSFSFLANTKESGAGLMKLIAGVCLSALFIGLILHLSYAPFFERQSILYMISLLSFVLIYSFHKDHKSFWMWALFLIHNTSLLFLLFLFQNTHGPSFLFALSSILLLGSITYAMVMGHWYLVTPKLSERPLKWAIYFTWILIIGKMIMSGITVMESQEFFQEGTRLGGGYAFNWLMLLMRGIWGYLVTGVMSYFAYRLVSMRSIQSATGILYAMTFFVFVGELISAYLFFSYGMFL